MDDDSLEKIQSKIAFLEGAMTELSDVMYRQQMEIQALAAQLRALADRLSGSASEDASRTAEQERPPHY